MTVIELTLSYSVPKYVAKVSECLHLDGLGHERLFEQSKRSCPCVSCPIYHNGHSKRSCVACDLNELCPKHALLCITPNTQVAGNVRFVQKYIESTLLEDLTRYKELLKEIRAEGRA